VAPTVIYDYCYVVTANCLIFGSGTYDLNHESKLLMSRVAALFLMFMYVQLVVFQLWTHRHLFEDDEDDEEDTDDAPVSTIEPSCTMTWRKRAS